jgi:hypothetical protein
MPRVPRQLVTCLAVVMLGLPVGLAVSATAGEAPQRARPIVVRVDGGGFRWADAGIGALAATGTALGVVGSVALIRSRQPRDIRQEEGKRP